MKISAVALPEAYASLRSRPDGLTTHEARKRLAEFGPNRVERAPPIPLAEHLVRDFFNFFAVLLWLAAGLAFLAESQHPGEGMLALGFAIVAVVLVNGTFSFWQEYRAERAIEALEDLLPHEVSVMRDGALGRRPAAELVPGDVIALEEGDEVPADARIVEAHAILVNDATITGESVPRPRSAGESDAQEPQHAPNLVLAGTMVVGGRAQALVFATGMRTEFGRIAHLTQAAREPLSPLQREIVRLSRVIGSIAVAMGVVFYWLGKFAGLSGWESFLFSIGIIVANVPEGLLPTVTLSLAMSAQRMAGRNALVRHLPAVEALGAATVICTDKTGTLTENRMEARRVFVCDVERDPRAFGPRDVEANRALFEVALHCQDLERMETGELVGDPMEVALVTMARRALGDAQELPRVADIPFDAERKRLATVHADSAGRVLYVKGAPETVLPLCRSERGPDGECRLDPARRAAVLAGAERMASEGLRVLALAWRRLGADDVDGFERELELCGLVGLEDPYRPEVPEAIRRCRDAGIRVLMVTGDHPRTAIALGRQIGLFGAEDPEVIRGEQLRRMSSTQLQLALDAPDLLFARLAPDQKLRIVEALQGKREVVAVTGDGVNDAPALRAADIGVAMGRTGTDVARQSSDIVLADDNFASIVSAVEEGRAVFANIRKFMTYILTSNVAEMVPYLAFSLFRVPLALTVLQILAIDLGTDLLPALGLGAERPEPDVMRAPARRRGERLMSSGLLARAYLFLGPLEAAGSMAVFFLVLKAGGWSSGLSLAPGLHASATAACLATIVVMQVANVFACRSDRLSALSPALHANAWIFAGVAVELGLILAIVYLPQGQRVFGTGPLPAIAWAAGACCALALLVAEELRKAVVRQRPVRAQPAALPVAARWTAARRHA